MIVIVLASHAAVTPAGSPVVVPIPVAPVVAIVIGVRALLTQTVGFADGLPAVLVPLTATMVADEVAEHPPPSVSVTV